jgi:hypothetical protein
MLAASAVHASTATRASQSRSGGVGLTSSIGAEAFPFPAAAGRRGIPRRSSNWSLSLTELPMRQARSAGLRPGAAASAWTISNSRRALSTMRPGNVSRQADSIASFLFSLRCRLWGLAFGATDSSSGIGSLCPTKQRLATEKGHFATKTEIPEPEDLTHKGLYVKVPTHI